MRGVPKTSLTRVPHLVSRPPAHPPVCPTQPTQTPNLTLFALHDQVPRGEGWQDLQGRAEGRAEAGVGGHRPWGTLEALSARSPVTAGLTARFEKLTPLDL